MHVLVYIIGWLIFVLTQAQNSIRSSSNGLQGKAGYLQWLQLHAVDLLVRAFFSAILYGFILNTVSAKLSALGFPLTATSIAGCGGFFANAVLYQFTGLVPGLRVEVGELAPPAPVPGPPSVGCLADLSPPPGAGG